MVLQAARGLRIRREDSLELVQDDEPSFQLREMIQERVPGQVGYRKPGRFRRHLPGEGLPLPGRVRLIDEEIEASVFLAQLPQELGLAEPTPSVDAHERGTRALENPPECFQLF